MEMMGRGTRGRNWMEEGYGKVNYSEGGVPVLNRLRYALILCNNLFICSMFGSSVID